MLSTASAAASEISSTTAKIATSILPRKCGNRLCVRCAAVRAEVGDGQRGPAAVDAARERERHAEVLGQRMLGLDVQPHDRLLELVEAALPCEPAVLEDPHFVRGPLEVRHDVAREQHDPRRVARDVDDLAQEFAPRDWIEARDRLVEHEQRRPMTEREQQRQLLSLADRHGPDATVERHLPVAYQPIDQRIVPVPVERLRDLQLLVAAQHADQLVLLRHETDTRLDGLGHARAFLAEHYGAAAARQTEAEQDLEQRRLARAVLAEDADDVARLRRDRHAVENRSRAEALRQAFRTDHRLRVSHLAAPTSR
jgi:hypothetical protein